MQNAKNIRKEKRKPLVLLLTLLFVFALSITMSMAFEQKLPTRDFQPPQTVSLQLDESFKTNLFTGAFIYTYDLAIPPGTNDLSPGLALFYVSQKTTSPSTLLGTGWQLSESYVQRNVNSTPSDTSDDSFTLVLEGTQHELVDVPEESRYHTKIESFLHIRKENTSDNEKGEYWVVKTTDGTSYRLGYNLDAETPSDHGDFAWRWYLDLVNDTYNNSIFYSYNETPFSSDKNATYLVNITYNNDRERVINFTYEEADRPDNIQTYIQGNSIRQSRRLTKISIAGEDKLVREYLFQYSVTANNSKTFLTNITLFGNDGTSLPPTLFDYHDATPNWTSNSTFHPPTCLSEHFSLDGTDSAARLVDVNNDGFVDIVRSSGISTSGGCTGFGPQEAWINNGTGWTSNSTWIPPTCFAEHFSLGGTDVGTRLADVNNDGLVDIIRKSGDEFNPGCSSGGPEGAWINNGNGWESDPTWIPPTCFAEHHFFDGSDLGVRLVDVNGDGLVDLLKGAGPTGGGCSTVSQGAWINNGSGWVDDPAWYPPTCFAQHHAQDGTDNGARLVDVNGDGLPDIIRRIGPAGGGCYPLSTGGAWINNGSGWVADETWYPPTCFTETASLARDLGTRLLDVNRDGLVDIVRSSGESGQGGCSPDGIREAWINNGAGWVSDDSWNPSACFAEHWDVGGTDLGTRLADMNGDGHTDIIRGSGKKDQGGCSELGPLEAYTNNADRSFLLKKVTNPFGGSISIGYKELTTLNNRGGDAISDIGFNLWVVSSITQSNGMNGSHNITATTRYNYSGGLYDYRERDFRGFSFAEETRPDRTLVQHHFHQDEAKKGREFKTEILDSQENLFQAREFLWNATENSTEGGSYFITHLLAENMSTFDGSPTNPSVSSITYAYDTFGNLVSRTSFGDIDLEGDERFEFWEYEPNTTAWITDKPSFYQLLADNNNTIVRQTNFSYDNLSFGEAPTKGSVTLQEDVLTTGPNSMTHFDYNAHGNLVNQTDPNGHTTLFVFGETETTFTFPDKDINPLSQETIYTWNLSLGKPASITDPNGFSTNYTYDTFGRLSTEIRRLDSEAFPTIEYQYERDGVAPERIKILQRETAGQDRTFDSWQYLDGLSLLVTRKQESESGQIRTDTFYDTNLRVSNKSNPHFTSLEEDFSPANTSINVTRFAYDPLDRLTRLTNPDGTVQNHTHDHWNITILDENSNQITQTVDAFGQITHIYESLGSEEALTQYDYDVAGSLITITDSENNVWQFTFDTLGRQTSLVDPDLGSWNFTFDPSGNLVEQTDARGIATSLAYDPLNRLTRKNSSTQDYVYTYDKQYDGTLSGVQGNSYATNLTYDSRLRVVTEEKTITGNSTLTIFQYDSLDRPTLITLPNQVQIDLDYNNQSQLDSIQSVIDNIDYNPLNLPFGRAYSNGLVTNLTYSQDNLRLTNITTGSIQALHYQYDNASNLLSINDTSNHIHLSLTYDSLNRLISASRQDEGENHNNLTINYSYSSTGNLLSVTTNDNNTHLAYLYNSSPPAHMPFQTVQTGPLLEVTNLQHLATNGTLHTYRFDIQNNAPSTLSDVNWTFHTGESILQSQLPITLAPGEDAWIFLEVNFTSPPEQYTQVAIAYTSQLFDLESTTTFLPDPNTTHALLYDQNGNLIQDTQHYYEYNSFNQLSAVRLGDDSGPVIESYLYDHEGTRIHKSTPNDSTIYVNRNYLKTFNSSGMTETVYYLHGSALVARKEGPTTLFYHPDHLGSTTLITNSSGSEVQHTNYYPFGLPIYQGTSRFLYTGKELDPGTGLQYFGARYYSPQLRRFVSPDSLLPDLYNPQALNRYSYVLNNPYKYTDPDGNAPQIVVGALLGAATSSVLLAVDVYNRGYYATPGEVTNVLISGAAAGAVGAAYLSGLPSATIFQKAAKLGVEQLSNALIKESTQQSIEDAFGPDFAVSDSSSPLNLISGFSDSEIFDFIEGITPKTPSLGTEKEGLGSSDIRKRNVNDELLRNTQIQSQQVIQEPQGFNPLAGFYTEGIDTDFLRFLLGQGEDPR